MFTFTNHLPRPDAVLGFVVAEGVEVDRVPEGFEAYLADLIARRQADLPEALETRRQAVRDLLRNGTYKPTGRAKPATEYLLRTVSEGAFPRINAPVDICNALCAEHLLPISLWDLDLAGAADFTFRLGQEGEAYVFNSGGQEIGLQDLIVGCRVVEGAETPIVNPVKDSLATKTTDATRRVAAVVYSSTDAASVEVLQDELAHFERWLRGAGSAVQAARGIAARGETCMLRPA